MSPSHHKFNVLLVGDAGVGKVAEATSACARESLISNQSCFIRKHQTGDFFKDYVPTTKVQAYTLPWNTVSCLLPMCDGRAQLTRSHLDCWIYRHDCMGDPRQQRVVQCELGGPKKGRCSVNHV